MTTKARFRINSVTESIGSRPTGEKTESGHDKWESCPVFTIDASPVYSNGDPNHPNTKFWAASPGGKFELTCVNPAAVEGWKPGVIIEFDINIVPEGK